MAAPGHRSGSAPGAPLSSEGGTRTGRLGAALATHRVAILQARHDGIKIVRELRQGSGERYGVSGFDRVTTPRVHAGPAPAIL